MLEENKLSLEYVEEVADQFKEQKEIEIEITTIDGKERVGLTIDKYFSPIKIKLCVKELISKLDILRKYLKDYKEVDEIFQCWLILLLIKHFSSLEIPYDFKRQVAILDRLVETTVLFQIFANFNKKEIEKIMQQLELVTVDALFKIEQFKDVFDKLDQDQTLSKEKIREIIEGK
jgi:hypothetical protein